MPVLLVEGAFMTNSVDFARLTDSSGAYGRNLMAGVSDGVVAYFEGRDLPPVLNPAAPRQIATGIFDLGGRPVVPPGGEVGNDSGSAWDTSGGQTADSASADDTSASESDSSADNQQAGTDSGNKSDDADEYDRLRGRGAYRHHH
jgi:hypothetical protein